VARRAARDLAQGPAPAPDRALADEDATTRAAVRWVRDAWLALPVPAAQPPRVSAGVAARAPLAPVERLRWRRLAVAAALLVALGVPLLVLAARRAVRRGRRTAHRSPTRPAPRPRARPSPPRRPALPAPEPCRPRSPPSTTDHLELRSGPVHLYLITASPSSNDEVPR
jgi:hypothetical protein